MTKCRQLLCAEFGRELQTRQAEPSQKIQKYIAFDEQAGPMRGVKFFFSGDAIPDGSKPNSAKYIMDKHTSSRQWQMELTLC
jgi:hypothetical protein